jgi:hypothetical protein
MDLIQPRMEASQQMDEGVYRFVPAEWTSSIGRFCPLRKNAPRASGRREITALPNVPRPASHAFSLRIIAATKPKPVSSRLSPASLKVSPTPISSKQRHCSSNSTDGTWRPELWLGLKPSLSLNPLSAYIAMNTQGYNTSTRLCRPG